MTDSWGTPKWGVRQRKAVEDGELGERFRPENTEADLAAVLEALSKLD